MSPGSPDASDELQVIPRRPSDGPAAAGPSSRPPASGASPDLPADPARRKRMVRVVGAALGLCAFILVAAGVARAVRPHDTSGSAPSASASVSAAPVASAAPAAAPSAPATPPPSPAAPTSGTLYFDPPARPGKVWVDGKKITTRSIDVPCGTHKIKIGGGKTKPVTLTCGAEVHLTH